MFKRTIMIDSLSSGFGAAKQFFLAQGIFLILIGVAIWLKPQLLVAFIAGLFIFFGLVLVFLGLKTGRGKNDVYIQRNDF